MDDATRILPAGSRVTVGGRVLKLLASVAVEPTTAAPEPARSVHSWADYEPTDREPRTIDPDHLSFADMSAVTDGGMSAEALTVLKAH